MYNIAVIGGGVIGLTTATEIQNHLRSKVKVTIYSEKLSPHTTSDVAAGLWGPYLVQDTCREKLLEWGKATHDLFFDLWKNGYANEAGISLQPVKSVLDDFEGCYSKDIVIGTQPLSPQQLQEVSKLAGKSYSAGISYLSFACEPIKFLPFLLNKFLNKGGSVKVKKITSFEELSDHDIIVNCTGLNAFDLTEDVELSPIRGQIARVKAPWQFHTILADKGYIITNTDSIVLGGTAQVGNYNTNVCESDAKNILDSCYRFSPTLKNAEIIKHIVGLRPGRRQVRLELEIVNVKGKSMPVFHNYGHGGAGVTVSYGCALSTVKLIENFFNASYKSKL